MVLDRVNKTGRGASGGGTTGGVGFHGKRIQAGLSTQIVIMVRDDDNREFPIGAIQSMDVTENRTITAVHEVGTDAILQYVPTSATTYELTIARMVFDFQRLPQALQREYRHINAQRRPFDIVYVDYNPYLSQGGSPPGEAGVNVSNDGAGNVTLPDSTADTAGIIKTTFGNCWFTNLSYTFTANDYLITENASLVCEYVTDSNSPQIQSGDSDTLESDTNRNGATASIMSQFDRET